MKKLFRLVRAQFWVVLSDMFSIGKKRSKRPKLLYIGAFAMVLFLTAISFLYSYMIGSGLNMFHCIEILPSVMMALTCFITFFTTVFKVKGTIFGFRDYDMIMSLPINTGVIAASRLILLYMLDFVFVIIVMLPMMLAYGILTRPNPAFYVIGLITMFFVPLIPIVIATFLGTVIAYAASRFRHSNLINIIFSAGFIVLILVASFGLNNSGSELANMTKAMTARINAIYPLAGMYTNAVVHYDMVDFILFIGSSSAAFLLYIVVVKRIFKKLNTLMMNGSYHVNYKLGELKASSPFKALYRKELKRFFSSTPYAINAGFGIVMLTLGAAALIFVDPAKLLGGPDTADIVVKFIPVYIEFCIVMTCSTMASISLEGKGLWIIKSLPVPPRTVYLSKIAMNLTILLPAVIDVIVIGIVLKIGLLKTLAVLLVSAACAVFISFYGLFINLLLPNFNWTSETVVVKNSASTMITVFSSLAYAAVEFLFVMIIPSVTVAYLGYFVLTVLVDVALYAALMTYGRRRYNFL